MGATSFYTPEIGQNGLDKWIVSPWQFVARVIYLLVVGLFIAPIGALYHALAGLYFTLMDHSAREYSSEHFKAAFQDLTSITGLRNIRFCVQPHRAVSPLFSATEIIIPGQSEPNCSHKELIAASLNIRQTHGMSRLPEYYDKRVVGLVGQTSGKGPILSLKEDGLRQAVVGFTVRSEITGL